MTLVLGQLGVVGMLLLSPLVPAFRTAPPVDVPQPVTVARKTPAPYPKKQEVAYQPVVGAKSALVVDLPSGTTLYSKDPGKPLPIASLTKLMTALLVVERTDGADPVTVPERLPGSGPDESRMALRPGKDSEWRHARDSS